MTPKRPTLPEGTDPVEALRRLQRQLAGARAVQRPGTVDRSVTSYEEGGKDAERAAGMNLAPIVDAVEALVAELRTLVQRLRMEAFASPGHKGWNVPAGVMYVPPGLGDEELERIRAILAETDHVRVARGPVEYPVPALTRDQERNLVHGGHPEAKPRARVAYPPPATEWRHGFPPKGAATMWRCQRCGTNHEGNPPGCLHCGYTVLDPGYWIALPPR